MFDEGVATATTPRAGETEVTDGVDEDGPAGVEEELPEGTDAARDGAI